LEVIHLNRAAEAGALSASFAHDLGQPLAAIALSSQLAEDLLDAASPQPAKLKQAVTNIRRANDYAMKVNKQFGQLLKRKTDQEVEECDINAIVDDAVHILRAEAKSRHIDLVIEGAPVPLLVRADPVHLLQVVFNLATNAMDAMADMPPGARKLRIQTALDGSSSVRVTVADSGPGIPRDKIKEVFSSFYTTKKHGTGLGLSIAKTIVETYGGSIWAENASGGGAMVCFALPLQRPVSSMRRVVDGQLRALRPLFSTRAGKGASDPPPAASQPGAPKPLSGGGRRT
jgi:signal transduction histidine kinase